MYGGVAAKKDSFLPHFYMKKPLRSTGRLSKCTLSEGTGGGFEEGAMRTYVLCVNQEPEHQRLDRC